MRRAFLIAGLVLATLLLAGLGASISLVRSIRSRITTPSLAFERSTALAAVLPLTAVALVAWRTRVLPRWWAGFAGLVAIVLVAGPIGWLGLIFGVPIWTLGTSLFVLLSSRARMRTAAAAA